MPIVKCSNCLSPYPDTGAPYCCPFCGGVFDILKLEAFDKAMVDCRQPGIWKYSYTFGLEKNASVVSLGEGDTPLVWTHVNGKQIAFKCEYLNPTGSFKDRGNAVIAGFLCSRGVRYALEDSSGNAGASFAAYAARAGIKAKIFIPDSASGMKRRQIEMYGAEVVRILGPRSNAAEAVLRAADNEHVYASHAYMPYNLPGYATLAYELVEQLGVSPGTVTMPIGQGGLFIGLVRGFENLVNAGMIAKVPKMVGVQALACAPLWALHQYGPAGLSLVGETKSLAEGIVVRFPVRGDMLLHLCDTYGAEVYAVEEPEITQGYLELARRGFFVEPTSAVVWGALQAGMNRWPDPVVVILTGNGLKAVI